MANFNPKIDTGGFGANVIEAPNIEYDQKEIKPALIEQQKWDIIYKVTIFMLIGFIMLINLIVSKTYDISGKVAATNVAIKDLEPVVKKVKIVTTGVNYDQLAINRFILENLFFVGDNNYEIIQKYKRFFEDPNVITQLGSFKMTNISIDGSAIGDKKTDIIKLPIKIDGSFSSFNKDIRGMISFLNNMTPVIVINDIKFSKGNNVNFVGYILVMKKSLLKYDYGSNYKQINNLVRLKEEYEQNSLILDRILADNDINFKIVGISKVYNCDQYAALLAKQNIIKETEIGQCRDVESLLKNIQSEIDKGFNSLLK